MNMPGQAYSAAAMAPRPVSQRAERFGPAGALGVALMCVVSLALVWVVASFVPAAEWRDALALHDFTQLSRPGVDGPAHFLLDLLSPLVFILWGVALMAIALVQERPRVAVAVAAVMGLAPATSETLKPLLAQPHIQLGIVHVGAASWPSGHATAAMSLALSAVFVAPPRMRLLVGSIGAAFVLAVGCSLLILAWHMPSDVLGGYLVASLWMALAVAGMRALERRWPSRSSR